MSSFFSIAISSLDSSKSLLPFFVKDSIDNAGRTVMAYNEGGKHEAREKFIEENATSLFWLGGIPAVRWAANKIYKKKFDTDIHFKRINSDGIQNYFADSWKKADGTLKFSPDDLKGITLGGDKLKLVQEKLKGQGFVPNIKVGNYKKYHRGVTAASVFINLFMLTVAIPMFNQYLSRKIISKEFNKNIKKKAKDNFGNNVSFSQFSSNTHHPDIKRKPTFTSMRDFVDFKKLLNFTEMAEVSQMNTTNSMLLLDYGISGSRVTFVPRDNNERIEYIVKEGGIILFFYQAADWIRNGFIYLANKGFKTPINLDFKIINDKEFAKNMKNCKNPDSLFKFVNIVEKDDKSEIKVIKFIDEELKNVATNSRDNVFDNFTLKMAQKHGLIDVEYDGKLKKWIRHSKKYVDTQKVIELNSNLKDFYENASKSSLASIQKVISKTKAVKSLSVLGNIAICSFTLCYLLPKFQYFIREHRTKTNTAPGIKVYQDRAEQNLM